MTATFDTLKLARQFEAAGFEPKLAGDMAAAIAVAMPVLVTEGVQQIGANCRSRVEAEEQNKQRRHQRSAADAGRAYHEAHAESGQGIGEHDKFKRAHGGCGVNSRAFAAR